MARGRTDNCTRKVVMDFVTLSKILPLFVYPFNIALWLIFAALFLLWRRRNRGAVVCIALASTILMVAGNPQIARFLYASHERTFLPVPVEESPTADAIVVLGGALNHPLPPRLSADLNSASDRLLHATRLYRAGKAPRVIITGGNVFPQPDIEAESFYMQELLEEWGVPRSAILTEGQSRNTYENAVNIRSMLSDQNISKVLLATSAFHMPRAHAVFASAGIHVIPSPTDYRVVDANEPLALTFIPDIGALSAINVYIREHLGMFVYRYKGWIKDTTSPDPSTDN